MSKIKNAIEVINRRRRVLAETDKHAAAELEWVLELLLDVDRPPQPPRESMIRGLAASLGLSLDDTVNEEGGGWYGGYRRMRPYYVYAVGYTRHYGGPEEGGWWYDNRHRLDVYECWTAEEIREATQQLRDEYPTCPRGRSSVIGGMDVEIGITCDTEKIPTDDRRRPHYE